MILAPGFCRVCGVVAALHLHESALISMSQTISAVFEFPVSEFHAAVDYP